MTPGPTLVLASPCCGHLHRLATIASGNTFGATLWSDGKLDAPMLPAPPRIARCGGCRTLFWVGDAKEVGRIGIARPSTGKDGAPEVASEWQQAPMIGSPDIDVLAEAVTDPRFAARDRWRHVRISLWHALNEPRRQRPGDKDQEQRAAAFQQRYGALFAQNLEALLELIEETAPDGRLQKAEALRELGRFDACIRLLDQDFDEPLASYARQIRQRALARDPTVFRLDWPAPKAAHPPAPGKSIRRIRWPMRIAAWVKNRLT